MTRGIWERMLRGESSKAQFCQCWVFSAVTTTFGRSAGLLVRSITNFQSAHDKNNDRTVTRVKARVPRSTPAGGGKGLLIVHGEDYFGTINVPSENECINYCYSD